jgi:hypothetical protein
MISSRGDFSESFVEVVLVLLSAMSSWIICNGEEDDR